MCEQRLLDPIMSCPTLTTDDYSSQLGTLGYPRHTRPDLCVGMSVAAQFGKKNQVRTPALPN